MATNIKTKFSGIGSKADGSQISSTEWNGVITELELINASNTVNIGKDVVNTIPDAVSEPSVLIGKGATDAESPSPIAHGNGAMTAVGIYAKASDWRATAIGAKAAAASVSSTAVGFGASVDTGSAHGIAIGRGAQCPKNSGSNICLGSSSNHDLYIANGWGHKLGTPYSGITDLDKDPVNTEARIHGQDAFDNRDTPSEFNVAGGHLGICSGRGTGTGQGGEVRFKTAPVQNLGGNNKNTLVDAAKFDSAQISGNDTRFLLLDLTDGTMKRVSFGADDSGGIGYKALRVVN